MSRKYLSLAIVAVVLLIAVSSVGAITKAPKRLWVLDFNGGYTVPGGSYDHLGSFNFIQQIGPEVDGSELFNNSYALGLSLGMVHGGHWLSSIGFQYSHVSVKNPFMAQDGNSYLITPLPHYNQYDLRLRTDFYFSDLEYKPWSPFVGVTLAAGATSESLTGYRTESETNVALGVNFGAEVRIWEDSNKRNFVTLASSNCWEFVTSGYRPQNLTIGASLKIYARP